VKEEEECAQRKKKMVIQNVQQQVKKLIVQYQSTQVCGQGDWMEDSSATSSSTNVCESK
jgi:hypothetical protein